MYYETRNMQSKLIIGTFKMNSLSNASSRLIESAIMIFSWRLSATSLMTESDSCDDGRWNTGLADPRWNADRPLTLGDCAGDGLRCLERLLGDGEGEGLWEAWRLAFAVAWNGSVTELNMTPIAQLVKIAWNGSVIELNMTPTAQLVKILAWTPSLEQILSQQQNFLEGCVWHGDSFIANKGLPRIWTQRYGPSVLICFFFFIGTSQLSFQLVFYCYHNKTINDNVFFVCYFKKLEHIANSKAKNKK